MQSRATLSVALVALTAGCARDNPPPIVRTVIAPPAAPLMASSTAAAETGGVRNLFNPIVRKQDPAAMAAANAPVRSVFKPQVTERAQVAARGPIQSLAPEKRDGSHLSLVGITETRDGLSALIETGERGRTQTVRKGDTVLGFEVGRINGDHVILVRGGETRTLNLGEGKPDAKIVLMSDEEVKPLRLDDPANAQMAGWPAPVMQVISRHMPREGELRRARVEENGGQLVYEVEKRVHGLQWEIRVDSAGQILRIASQINRDALPPAVVTAANSHMPGYSVNPEDTPRLQDRDGTRYYEVEIKQEDGPQEIDLRILPDGRVLGTR